MLKPAVKALVLVSTALATPAFGQVAGGEEDPRAIVVTASRQATSLQDTALNVNALSDEKLLASGVNDTTQLQNLVPNLQFTSSGQSGFIYLRGIGSNIFGSFSSNSVASYVDGAYVATQAVSAQEFYDIERVEVLRGPQATLYGRNATGGAILLSTANPTKELLIKGDLDYGNYDSLRATAVVSGPVIGDTVSARVAVLRTRRDGYSVNLRTGDRFDSRDFWAARATLLIEPTEHIQISIKGTYTKEDGAPGNSHALDPNSAAFQNGPAFPFPPFGPQWTASRFASGPREAYNDVVNHQPTETYGTNIKIEFDLGPVSLISTSAYQRTKSGPTFQDLDDSEAVIRGYLPAFSSADDYFQDLLLSSEPGTGKFQWMLGATFTSEKSSAGTAFLTQFGVFGSPTEPVTFAADESVSAYVQASFDISEKLRLVSGLRYSSETRKGRTASGSKAVTWNDLSPRFSLEFRPVDGLLAYASATKGFKSGVFDPRDLNNVGSPERIWNYEVGLKSEMFDGRLILNANAFYYDYTNLQVFSGRLVTLNGQPQIVALVQNAGDATVKGVEIEATVHPTDNVTFGLNGGYLDGRYGAGSLLVDTSKPTNPVIDINGFRMLQSPTLSGSFFGEVRIPLANDSSIVLNGDVSYQGARYFSAFEDATLHAGATATANARITYNLPGNNIYIAGYIRNISDKLVISSMMRVLPVGRAASYTAPRLYGVQAGFRF